ncbi:MAG: DUF4236 domain-containing protein [Rhodoplanes sp.]
MGWRFRRGVRLFPGVRLNFSAGGLSTTIGVRGASINVGKSGSYLNLGLPGTGISYREKLLPGRPPQQSLPAQPLQSPPQGPKSLTPPSDDPKPGEIRSAAVSGMTSTGLEDFKRLINEAALRRVTLVSCVAQGKHQLEETKKRLRRAQRFLVRLFMRKRIPRLAHAVQEASAKLTEDRAELAACEIEVDFAFDDVTLNAFAALVRAYESLRGCAAIWDITNTVIANRRVLRTTADELVNRNRVQLEFGTSAIIMSKYQALVLGNANGEDIYIYPGFVMMRSPGQDFALIDVRDLVLELRLSRFFEEEQVPSDSEVVGYTWAKTNRDGSPDRRFRDNYQIPVVQYAQLWFRSPTGLQEAYLISNFGTTEAFVAAFREYQMALRGLADRSKWSTIDSSKNQPETCPPPEEVPGLEIDEPSSTPIVAARPKSLFLDWMALGAIGLLLASGIYIAATRDGLFRGLAVGLSSARLGMSAPIEPTKVQPSVQNPKQLGATATREMVFVQRAGANVRAEPSTRAPIVRTEPRGKQLAVFQLSGQWVQVGEAAPFGWIYSDLLGPKAP